MTVARDDHTINTDDMAQNKAKLTTDAIAGAGKRDAEPQLSEEEQRSLRSHERRDGSGVALEPLFDGNVDHDFRDLCGKLNGTVPSYFMTGVYDFACTPEMTEQTAKKVKNSECIIMEEIDHFPMCENPMTFKRYLMPVLAKVLQNR